MLVSVTNDSLSLCLQFGARFHTRASVLKFGHVANRRDLPNGIADALSYSGQLFYGDQAEGSSVDP